MFIIEELTEKNIKKKKKGILCLECLLNSFGENLLVLTMNESCASNRHMS
jgi:hypothetical protein